jgi:hypothetical protein
VRGTSVRYWGNVRAAAPDRKCPLIGVGAMTAVAALPPLGTRSSTTAKDWLRTSGFGPSMPVVDSHRPFDLRRSRRFQSADHDGISQQFKANAAGGSMGQAPWGRPCLPQESLDNSSFRANYFHRSNPL